MGSVVRRAVIVIAVLALALPGLAHAHAAFGGEGSAFQVVVYPGDVSSVLYVADTDSNAPIAGASIEVDAGGWRGSARATATAGIYELAWKPPPHGADLVISILASGKDDLILIRVTGGDAEIMSGVSWVLIAAGLVLVLAGFAIRRREPVVVLVFGLLGAIGPVFAHGGDDHGEAATVPVGGPTVMDKPTQFQVELRTERVEPRELADGRRAIAVPRDAVHEISGHQAVFVRVTPEVFEARQVTVERVVGSLAVLADGVRAGERVAIQGGDQLQALAIVPLTPPVADGAWYGGQFSETPEGIRIEIAVRDGAVRAWVRDAADKPLPASGIATMRIGGKTVEARLDSDGDAITAQAPVASSDRLAVILRLQAGGKAVAARFAQEALVKPALSPETEAGKAAFERVCAQCHGATLRGSDKGPPLLHRLYAPGSGHGDSAILAAMANGALAHMWKFGEMPKPEGLAVGEDRRVLAYIRAMQTANGLGDGTGLASDLCVVGTPGR